MAWSAFAGLAVIAFAYLLWEGRGNTFFYDEWSWIEVLRSGLHSILGSYNEHMEVLPLAVYQLLFHTVGISTYWPYQVLAALGHLACVTAIFAFALRRVGTVALLIAVPLAFFGAGWEFILWGVNFGFTTSIALSVAALIWLERGDRRGTAVACALLTVGLLFSETALLFALGVAVELSWRDRSLRRMWVWALPVLVYALWWVAFYTPYLSEHDVGAIPTFTARLAASAAGGLFGLGTRPGWAVLAGIVAVLALLIVGRHTLSPRLVGLAVTALLFWGIVAFGRAELGQPGASKYVYTGSMLLVLLVLEAVRGLRPNRVAVALVALLATASLVGNLRAFGPGEAWLNSGSRTTAAELGGLELARATAPAGLVLDPLWAPQVIAGQYFAAARALGSTPAVPPARLPGQPATIRVAVDRLLVRAGALALAPAGPSTRLSGVAPTVAPVPNGRISRRGGCVSLTPGAPSTVFDLPLPGSGLELSASPAHGAASPPSPVIVRRFAHVYAAPVAILAGGAPTVIKPHADGDPVPWQMRIVARGPVIACTVSR